MSAKAELRHLLDRVTEGEAVAILEYAQVLLAERTRAKQAQRQPRETTAPQHDRPPAAADGAPLVH